MKEKLETLKNRFLSFTEQFKLYSPKKKAITGIIATLLLIILIIAIVLLRGVIGKILIGIGIIIFISGIIIGIIEKSFFFAVIIILLSMIPIGLGNALSPKNETEPIKNASEDVIRSISDADSETDTETTTKEQMTEVTTTAEETTEAPTTTEPETEPPTVPEYDYVVNMSSDIFHYPSCSSVGKIKSQNRADRHCTRDELIAEGYKPCGQCHP